MPKYKNDNPIGTANKSASYFVEYIKTQLIANKIHRNTTKQKNIKR